MKWHKWNSDASTFLTGLNINRIVLILVVLIVVWQGWSYRHFADQKRYQFRACHATFQNLGIRAKIVSLSNGNSRNYCMSDPLPESRAKINWKITITITFWSSLKLKTSWETPWSSHPWTSWSCLQRQFRVSMSQSVCWCSVLKLWLLGNFVTCRKWTFIDKILQG